MMRALTTTMLLSLLMLLPSKGYTENFQYISYTPDIRYSANGQDTRIFFNLEKMGYSYGHDFGSLHACTPEAQDCLAFDFMAISALPQDVTSGLQFTRGEFSFDVEDQVKLTVLGVNKVAFRVKVKKKGELANSFYYSLSDGVIAIGILNFSTTNIPESMFFASSGQGVFHTPAPPQPD